jgi:hypothetical protein
MNAGVKERYKGKKVKDRETNKKGKKEEQYLSKKVRFRHKEKYM